MPDHTGHSDAALTPWLCKRKVEVVVLDVGIAVYVTLEQRSDTEAAWRLATHSLRGHSDFLLQDGVPRI